MRNPDVIVIGGGQAGLVMSRGLTARGIDHIVLERGRIGERWFSERWKSLHLLTTAEMSALPGLSHGGDPEAFMPAGAFAAYLQTYARRMDAPVICGVEVTKVEPCARGYRVSSNAGQWQTRSVVIATGACDTPYRPSMAVTLPSSLLQISPANYREPDQLPDGGVLIVGASSTGVQLAEELHASGRPVVLSVGEHTRLPRRYRARDIYAWMETVGILDEAPPENSSPEPIRRQPSAQLVGRPDHRDLDLGVLSHQGVRLAGRLAGIEGAKARFDGDLARTTEAAHVRMMRTLERIDECIDSNGFDAPAPDPPAPFLADCDPLTLDLDRAGIRSVVWATGYIRRYPWLKAAVLDSRGEILHRRGVTNAPGLYVIGLTFQRRRRSHFIDGCGYDAEDLAPLVRDHLDESARQTAVSHGISGRVAAHR